MRISDWSSDVCSSDLHFGVVAQDFAHVVEVVVRPRWFGVGGLQRCELIFGKLDWRDRGHGSGGWEALPTILRRPSMGECFPCNRSEERRVGKECVSTFRSRW